MKMSQPSGLVGQPELRGLVSLTLQPWGGWVTLRRGQQVPMTGVPAEGGTIFMFERKTLWQSDM